MTKYRDGSADLFQEPGLACRFCRVTRLLPSAATGTCRRRARCPAVPLGLVPCSRRRGVRRQRKHGDERAQAGGRRDASETGRTTNTGIRVLTKSPAEQSTSTGSQVTGLEASKCGDDCPGRAALGRPSSGTASPAFWSPGRRSESPVIMDPWSDTAQRVSHSGERSGNTKMTIARSCAGSSTCWRTAGCCGRTSRLRSRSTASGQPTSRGNRSGSCWTIPRSVPD